MPLEIGTYIDDLVTTNPVSGDDVGQGDDHIRLLKTTIKNTFPNTDNEVNPTPAEFNRLVGATQDLSTTETNANNAADSTKALQPRLWPVVSNGTDADHDIDFSAGFISDSVGDDPMEVATALTKRLDANWVAGNNQGGFPSALTLSANTWYHLFIIKDVTNDLVDCGFDTSLTAANLLTDASDYTKYRRIASLKTDVSSNWPAFIQSGRDFSLGARATDIAETAPPTTVTATTFGSVPDGIKVKAKLNVQFRATRGTTTNGITTCHLMLSDGNLAAGIAAGGVSGDLSANTLAYYLAATNQGTDDGGVVTEVNIWTNTSQQIYVDSGFLEQAAPDSNPSLLYAVNVVGWEDPLI